MKSDAPAVDGMSIVFFDGVCGICNSFVDFVMPRDTAGQIHFAPLQGETATALLDEPNRQLDTMILRTPDGQWSHSSAVVRVLWLLGGFWALCGWMLWVVPKPLRDLGYRAFASIRYRIFGKKDSCRLPTPEEAGRILL